MTMSSTTCLPCMWCKSIAGYHPASCWVSPAVLTSCSWVETGLVRVKQSVKEHLLWLGQEFNPDPSIHWPLGKHMSVSRGLVELITPSQSRDLKKLTQIMKVLPSPMRVIKNILSSLKVFVKSYFVNSRHPTKRLIIWYIV